MGTRLFEPEIVEMKGVKVWPGKDEVSDFTFGMGMIPTSVARKFYENAGTVEELFTDELLGKLTKSWDGELLKDEAGELLPCTPDNVKMVLEDCFMFRQVLIDAALTAFNQRILKNSGASSDSTGKTEGNSAGAAENSAG